MRQLREAVLLLLAVVLTLSMVSIARAQTPNMVIEAAGDIDRLEVQLRADGMKEPMRYEFRGEGGTVFGGIELPKEGHADYEIAAYDREGNITHTGKGQIAGFVHADRAVTLPLEPIGEGDTLLGSVTRERLVLEVEPSNENYIGVRAHAYDPRGEGVEIKPGDLTWQLSDGRLINLIPNPNDNGIGLVPNKDLPVFELCSLAPEVTACKDATHCRPIRVCSDPFIKISAGGTHTCALTQNGFAFCWGSNGQGELGAPTTGSCIGTAATGPKCSPRPLPVVCPAGAPCKFTQISSGQTLTAAVDTNGDVWWWGRGAPDHHRVNAVLNGAAVKFSLVAAGFGHACAISQSRSEIWCWGTNAYGESGAPWMVQEVPDTAPVRVMVPGKFKRIVAGGEHTCAIGSSGFEVVCWGRNDQNQSSGPNSTTLPPTGSGPFYFQQFGGLTAVLDVATGQSDTCVTLSFGVRCWGEHWFYTVTGFGTPDKLAVGGGHICATKNQQALCMGQNNWGQIGNNSLLHQSAPVAVNAPPPLYAELTTGDTHTCGLTPEGDAFCWGINTSGQVGIGAVTFIAVKEPKKVIAP
jgi:alpha-tubulin suppressor-like RCC1 family protein